MYNITIYRYANGGHYMRTSYSFFVFITVRTILQSAKNLERRSIARSIQPCCAIERFPTFTYFLHD